MKQVLFHEINIGCWFKETADGVWYLKDTGNTGLSRSRGVTGNPNFNSSDLIWIN